MWGLQEGRSTRKNSSVKTSDDSFVPTQESSPSSLELGDGGPGQEQLQVESELINA